MTTGGVTYLIKKVVLAAILLIFLFFLRILYMQNLYVSECEKMQGIEKIKSCEKVVVFHFPLSPYTKKALNSLKNECESLTESKDKLYCYETLRSSLIQIKSFYQPYRNTLEEINPKIAHLRTTEAIKWQFNGYSVQDYEKLYRDNLAIVQYDNAPSVFWSLVLVFCLIGWIFSIFFLILSNFKESVKIKAIISFLLFFCLWLLGLWMA